MQTYIIIAIIFVVAAFSAGCQKASSAPPASNAAPADTTPKQPAEPEEAAEPKTAEPAEPQKTASVGSLATPTEAYKTAYELRKRKDIEGLKRVMSKDIKEFLTMMGEAEKKTLDDVLRQMADTPQADRAETRNEKIKGDRATVEYLSDTGEWRKMDFEKVEGEWLLTFPKADKTVVPEPER